MKVEKSTTNRKITEIPHLRFGFIGYGRKQVNHYLTTLTLNNPQ